MENAKGKKSLVRFDFAGFAYSNDYYYCSSLVRAAFLDAVPGLDLDPNKKGFVSPGDIAISSYTRRISKWSNY